ncbi:MAG TPA: fibronectin type III domain-containing protein [Candidatus Paceibacterota bacterium]|nr:fibronectin type III domain-containing protein [Candidatus Paceibacterota bacterium]
MRKLAIFGLTLAMIVSLAGGASAAHAAALTTAQTQAIITLLQSFGVDASTLANVEAVLNGQPAQSTATATATSTTAITPGMIGYLHYGDSGAAVRYLQTLLAADPSVYPNGLTTGFFGRLTEEALKRYQQLHGLDQVGFIGPQTLHDLDDDLQRTPFGFRSATSTAPGNGTPASLCAIVPPGHLIAPGWLRKHGERQYRLLPWCNGNTPTTTPPTPAPFAISGVAVSGLSTSTATVSWTTNEQGSTQLEYGLTASYGSVSALSTALVDSHSVTLAGLTASTTYHFRAMSTDASSTLVTSDDTTFTTAAIPADTTPPVISGAAVGNVASTSATVSWTTNEPSTSTVYFATTTPLDLSTATTAADASLVTSHSLLLSSLTASTTYYYAIESKDAANNTATTSEASFTTAN